MRINRVVVVGASLAGLRTAEALRAEGYEREIVFIGEEVHPPYDRPPLTKALFAGRGDLESVRLSQHEGLGAVWRLGCRAQRLEASSSRVWTDDGEELDFDALVIATGSVPRRLPAIDPTRTGVHELRTLDDALALRAEVGAGKRIVIVGGGFIGVEVASTAHELGAEVAIVTLDPPLAVAGAPAVAHALERLRSAGIAVHAGRTVARLPGATRPTVAVLDDGTELPVDLVVSAVGVVPATDWLTGSGLSLQNGVVCDATLTAAGARQIVAVGDVARWPNARCGGAPMRVEHWTNATEHARVAARTLMTDESAPHGSLPIFWSDHFGGRLQSVGLPGAADTFEFVEGDVGSDRFVAKGYRDGWLVGAITWNAPRSLVATRRELPDPLMPPGG